MLLMAKEWKHGEQLAEGRYKIVGVIGQGGMGTVYAAEDRRLPGKEWAIKEIRSSGRHVEELADEAALLIKLSHPNLPQIVDYFSSEDGLSGYLVMERIEGETLEARFERFGKAMPLDDVLRYAIQICDALIYLHGTQPSPTIHRDLKPSNLLIDAYDRIVLIDFGTARTYKAGHIQDTVRLGTHGFAAPEQLAGEQTDPRTDLYALGCVLYYLLSGGLVHSPGASIAEALASYSGNLICVVEKLLSVNREERYASALQVKSELSDIRNAIRREQGSVFGQPAPAHIAAPPHKRVIALLSLYPGAGSTMIGITLASLLNRSAIDHSYLEHPAAQSAIPIWVKLHHAGHTTWLPDPERMTEEQEWSAEAQLRLLFEQRNSILIADLSDCWEQHTAAELMQLADEIIVVTGPRRLLIESERCRARLWRLSELQESGKRIHLFLNNCEMLPVRPDDLMPFTADSRVKLPYCPALREFEWNEKPGSLLQDNRLESWSAPINRWLTQRMRDWGLLPRGKGRRRGWFR